jgi:hypothetical protein
MVKTGYQSLQGVEILHNSDFDQIFATVRQCYFDDEKQIKGVLGVLCTVLK